MIQRYSPTNNNQNTPTPHIPTIICHIEWNEISPTQQRSAPTSGDASLSFSMTRPLLDHFKEVHG
ncbi:MAG: hypothetical protein H6600_06980 [Flavobacteriales bacterium]|nr:hypothetical protein [Flavobacteriales bacterium]